MFIEVTKVLVFAAQSSHELVPPEVSNKSLDFGIVSHSICCVVISNYINLTGGIVKTLNSTLLDY